MSGVLAFAPSMELGERAQFIVGTPANLIFLFIGGNIILETHFKELVLAKITSRLYLFRPNRIAR